MIHLLPAAIMFFITIGFTALFVLPAMRYPRKSKLINFYWSGFWVYLAMIASLSGAANTLMILKLDTMTFSDAALFGVSTSFVVFVMFAWLRLSGGFIVTAFKRLRKRLAQNSPA